MSARGNKLRNVEKVREVIEKVGDDDFDMLADVLTGEDVTELCHGARLGVLGKALMRKPALLTLAKHLV